MRCPDLPACIRAAPRRAARGRRLVGCTGGRLAVDVAALRRAARGRLRYGGTGKLAARILRRGGPWPRHGRAGAIWQRQEAGGSQAGKSAGSMRRPASRRSGHGAGGPECPPLPAKSAAAPAPRSPKPGPVRGTNAQCGRAKQRGIIAHLGDPDGSMPSTAGAPSSAASSRSPAIVAGGTPPAPAPFGRRRPGWRRPRGGPVPATACAAAPGGGGGGASLQSPKTAPAGHAGGAPSRRRLPASGPLPSTRGARHSPCRGRRACRRPL